jgi:hypothetical protein
MMPVLLEDEPDSRTFDYANINAPVFFANSIDTYLFIQVCSCTPTSTLPRAHPAAIVSTRVS